MNFLAFKCLGTATFGVTLLCSCSRSPRPLAEDRIRPTLPAEVAVNEGAFPGNVLFVNLRLDGGEGMLFLVDTGAPRTVLDKSLEPKLGRRLGTRHSKMPFSPSQGDEGVYQAPKLYLGNTELITGAEIVTMELRRSRAIPMSGILGMDCLRHYCVQFDLAARKMRFLDPDHLNGEELGAAFPIIIVGDGAKPVIDANPFGDGTARLILDTGCCTDFVLPSPLFQRALQVEKAQRMGQAATEAGQLMRIASCSNALVFGGGYTDVELSENSIQPDLTVGCMGLRFLGRHLVTLNFPKRTMYLRRTSTGPLPNTAIKPLNKITGANAGGLYWLPLRARRAARIAQFCR